MEWKREYTEEIKKTIVAFANTEGGIVKIGVDDTGKAVGVENMDGTMLKVTNALRDAISPDITLFTQCRVENEDGKDMLAVQVQKGTARPYYLKKKGIRPEGVFVRQGASTVPATEAAILSMIRETGGDCFETSRSLCQELTFEDASAYFGRHGMDFGENQKRSLGLVGNDGMYTNLAALLSGQCSHTIKAAVFQGSVKTVFRDRIEIEGSLFSQMEQAYQYLDRYNRTRSEFQGLERQDIRDYPPEAVREALLNAVVHRDYSYSASILISIFDDRIEIVTVGGLLKGISYSDIMLGVSALRNPRLANIFYRLQLIEAYGTGLQKIRNSYEDSAVEPQVQVSDNAFKITLPNRNYYRERNGWQRPMAVQESFAYRAHPLGKREEAVLRMLDRGRLITRKEIQERLDISQASAILLLRDMVNRGLLEKEGNGKNTKYVRGVKAL